MSSSRAIPGLCSPTTIDPATDNPVPSIDPDLFFSDDPAEIAAAKAICHACPVMLVCRERAHQLDQFGRKVEFGVWGGESAEERLGRKPMGKTVYKPSPKQLARAAERQRLRRQRLREAVQDDHLLGQPA